MAERNYISDRRVRQKTAKAILVDLLGELYGVVSVSLGRGTGSGWLNVETRINVPYDVRFLLEKYLDKKIGLHSYYGDMSSEPDFCVSWRN